MQYLQTNLKGVYVRFDGTKAEIINKAELEKQQAFLTEQQKALPTLPDDKTLLKWSKENYPQVTGIEASRVAIEAELQKITTDLSNIK